MKQFNNLLKHGICEENKEMKILCIGNSSGIYCRTTQEGLQRSEGISTCVVLQYMPLLFPKHNIFISFPYFLNIFCVSVNYLTVSSYLPEFSALLNSNGIHRLYVRLATSSSEAMLVVIPLRLNFQRYFLFICLNNYAFTVWFGTHRRNFGF